MLFRSDAFFIDDHHRRCVGCDLELEIEWFFPSKKGDLVKVSPLCNKCYREETKVAIKKKELSLSSLREDAIKEMGGALKRILNRPVTRDDGPDIHELAKKSIAAIVDPVSGETGQDGLAAMVGRELGEIFKSTSADTRTRILRQKWATTFISMQEAIAKLKNDEPKIADLDEDQIQALLQFASKQVVLESAEIREALLNDPEVRAALLEDLKIQIVEADASGTQ